MNTNRRHLPIVLASFFVAAVALPGCPKRPPLVAEPGRNSGTQPGAIGVGAVPGSPMAGAGGMPGGPGPRAVAPGTTALGGGTPVTGTTIPALPSPKAFVETSALRDIHFGLDRYDIRPEDARILGENARWLETNPNASLLIEGHADERGTNEYNLALGERRAKAARDHLLSQGIAGSRITIISYGEERPLCTERAEACWAQNRRAHFLVKE